MGIGAIAIRAVFAYVFLLLLLRLSGKRTVAEGTALDFVVALILGDMVDDLLWAEVPASQFVAGIGVVMAAHVLVGALGVAFPPFERLVQGTPLTLLRDGALLPAALARERFGDDDAMAALRESGVADLRALERARFEPSGNVSVTKRPWAREAQGVDRDRVAAARNGAGAGEEGGE